ncbi:MAG: BatD family protein, partial [Bacteroidales bacterium]|nr:BatD family protein [Bacteroidales bacterium]
MVKTINFRLLYLLLLVIFLLQGSWLNAQVSCSAAAPPQVEAGQPFEYTLTLNERPNKISAVNFGNVKVLGGPDQVSYNQTTIDANGKVITNVSFKFTYVLQADNVGSLVIPGTSFIVDGNTVKSNNVTVNVVPSGQGRAANGNQNRTQQAQSQGTPQLADNDAFIKCYASKSSAYQGEQVVLTYKLYISGTFNGGYQVTNITPPSQNGLWSYQLGDPNAEAPRTTETLNGKRYTVFEIRKNAVFPQKTGEITIAPMSIDFVGRVVYQTQNSRSVWDQFFGGGQQAKDFNLNLKSNSIKLNVKSLPTTNQPENFDGVVGNYTIKSSLTRADLKANDATNLKITISGNGNLQHIEALNLV